MTGQSSDVVDLSKGAAIDRAVAIGWIPSVDSNPDAGLMLYVHCHEFSLATAIFKRLETSLLGIVRFHPVWHLRVYYFALVAIQNAKKTISKRRRWRRKARKYVDMIWTWVANCQAINLGHKLKLLVAEMQTLSRPYPADDVLKTAYDEAIVQSARSGFLQDAALAAALSSRAVRNKFEKRQYAKKSQNLYVKSLTLTVDCTFNSEKLTFFLASNFCREATYHGTRMESFHICGRKVVFIEILVKSMLRDLRSMAKVFKGGNGFWTKKEY
jgi:hypothetical protein